MPELWHQDVPNRKEQLVYKKKDEGRKVLSSALIFLDTNSSPAANRQESLLGSVPAKRKAAATGGPYG